MNYGIKGLTGPNVILYFIYQSTCAPKNLKTSCCVKNKTAHGASFDVLFLDVVLAFIPVQAQTTC